MKSGNTILYIIVAVIALALIFFLTIKNNQNNNLADENVAENTEESSTSENTNTKINPNTKNTNDTMIKNADIIIGGATMSHEKNIFDNLAESDDHTTLVSAIKASDLEQVLKGTDPMTIFAPTNSAFEKLPEGIVDELLKAENKNDLSGILTYYIAPGRYTSEDITEGLQIKTINGQSLTFNKKDDAWWINNTAVITITDGISNNGIIHAIDTVLLPN